MSQMLVRIDKKMNDALIEVAKAITIGDEAILMPKEAVFTILEGVMNQWVKNRSKEETAEIIGFKGARNEIIQEKTKDWAQSRRNSLQHQ